MNNHPEKPLSRHLSSNHDGMTLIFPAINQAARDYYHMAIMRGERILAASSEFDSESAAYFGDLRSLPFIYEDGFLDSLNHLVNAFCVRRLFCPVASVHGFIEELVREGKLEVELVGVSPIEEEVNEYKSLIKRASEIKVIVENIRSGLEPHIPDDSLSVLNIAGILRQANNIYGESNNDKIAAFIAIFPYVPQGDVIEIGSLLGKSASVLLYLASHFEVGNVLSIDPWSFDASLQKGSPEHIRTKLPAQWDYSIFPGALIVNLLPSANGNFNYLKLTSEHAAKQYSASFIADSEEFGRVGYLGKISVIHIDGNHDYEDVKKDCDLWLRHLAAGGVVVLDDYKWAHGDGPLRVGNELLQMHQDKIKWAVVCGKALFIKFSSPPVTR